MAKYQTFIGSRTHAVGVSMSTEEHDFLRSVSREERIPLSAVVRRLIRDEQNRRARREKAEAK